MVFKNIFSNRIKIFLFPFFQHPKKTPGAPFFYFLPGIKSLISIIFFLLGIKSLISILSATIFANSSIVVSLSIFCLKALTFELRPQNFQCFLTSNLKVGLVCLLKSSYLIVLFPFFKTLFSVYELYAIYI